QGVLAASEMPRLYASADCFVLPSRGEGWGRPYMEAASTQLAVLATRWSGPMDFLHDRNSFLIDIEGVVPAPRHSDREIYIGHGWAEPSADHLAALMKHVVADAGDRRARARLARKEFVARRKFKHHLSYACARIGCRPRLGRGGSGAGPLRRLRCLCGVPRQR